MSAHLAEVLLSGCMPAEDAKRLARIATFEKACTCCDTRYRLPDWRALRFNGIQDQGEGYPRLELRSCPCGTTLAIEVTDDGVPTC